MCAKKKFVVCRQCFLLFGFWLAATMLDATYGPALAESYPFTVTEDVYGTPRTIDFELTVPDDVPFVRGLAFNLSGRCGNWIGVFDAPWQAAASALDFGILTLDSGDLGSPTNPGCLFGDPFTDEPRQLLEAVLDTASSVSGQSQLVNVPIGLIGYSQGGLNSLIITGLAPERVISYSSVRGGSTVFKVPEAMKSVPGVLMAGSVDTVIPPASIEQAFESYRSQDAEVAYLVHWAQGHDDDESVRNGGQSTDLAWYWLAEAARERYPPHLVPSNIPGNAVALENIPLEDGWLGETPRLSPALIASPFPEINPYSNYSGDPQEASWLPNAAVANVYRAFAGIDPTRPNPQAPGQFLGSPLEFTSPPLFYLSDLPHGYVVEDEITVSVDPHEFDDVNTIVNMEFYDGDTLIGVDGHGPDWGLTFIPYEAGIHAMVAIATDDQGNRTSNFRVVVVQHHPADFNRDNLWNGDDIDLLIMEIAAGTNNPNFDLDDDGAVDLIDRDLWLAQSGGFNLASGNPYLVADFNLDSVVDVADFNVWNGGKFSNTGKWSLGDANGDGVTDVQDFNAWNENKFRSSDGFSSVPEPSAYISLLPVLLLASVSRTRRAWNVP